MGLGIISFIYFYPNFSLKYHFCFIAMHYLLCVCVCVCVRSRARACVHAFEMAEY